MAVINTNTSALSAMRFLNINQPGQQSAMQKLSSGLRINAAKDDAAGLAIVMRMLGEIGGTNQAIRNASDGISMAQVAEGGMQEVNQSLQRMRELAVQSANGTLTDQDRAALQQEFQSLQEEIGRIAETTEFNGQMVLSEAGGTEFQVGSGAEADNRIEVTTQDITDTSEGIGNALDSGTTSIASQSDARDALASIDSAVDRIASFRADYGAVQNRFESTIRNLDIQVENAEASKSRILDADYARQTAELARQQILEQSGIAMLGQANATAQGVLSLLRGG